MADLTNLRQRVRARAVFAVNRAAPRLRQTLQQTSPRESNRMMLNTRVEPRDLTAEVRVQTEYASFVREGTPPHQIRPRNRKYLAFYWPAAPENMGRLPDGRVLARRVNHPGTQPNPWYDQALSRWPDFLRDALRQAPN